MKTPIAYTLDLTANEAQFLLDLIGNHVVGPDKGRRGLADNVFHALVSTGMNWNESYKPGYDISGTVTVRLT